MEEETYSEPGYEEAMRAITTATSNWTIEFNQLAGTWNIGAWSMDPSEPREEREMIPSTAVLTIDKAEAESQRAMFAELPQLTDREQKMMAIYDAVIADEKIVRLQEILNHAKAYMFADNPKVVVAPVTAETVIFIREPVRTSRKQVRRPGSRVEGTVRSFFRAGKWQMDLLKDESYDSFANRVTMVEAEALAPLVPPPHRDKVQDSDLLLWEPIWLRQRETVINADPAVLRPLSNGLYKVIAAWDLTPVETMMLSGE